MPYISQQSRNQFFDLQSVLEDVVFSNAGELNYVLTLVITQYLATAGSRYQSMNDIVGALEGCKLEFYRRVVSGYEDSKILENGDVY